MADNTPVVLTGIRLRNNTSDNAAVRDIAYPAPTLYFGARLNTMWWETDQDDDHA